MEELIKEAEELAKSGVKELILVAQDTTKYGLDLYGKPEIAKLLSELDKIQGLHWIRMLYCYPESITDELLSVMKSSKKILPYIDMPAQHASASVIKRMHRKFDGDKILEVIRKIRGVLPNAILRSTLLVGFPGETEEDFECLIDFVKTARFDKLGCFAFSAEEGTPAYKLTDAVEDDIKERRAELVMDMQYEISDNRSRMNIGKIVEAVVEGYDENLGYIGRCWWDAPEIDVNVYIASEYELEIGSFVKVRIINVDNMDYDAVSVN